MFLTFIKGAALGTVIVFFFFAFIGGFAYAGMALEQKLAERGWGKGEVQVLAMMIMITIMGSGLGGFLAVASMR